MGLSDANDDMEDLPEEVIRERYMKYSNTINRGSHPGDKHMHLERVYKPTPHMGKNLLKAITIANSLSLEEFPSHDRVREVLKTIPDGEGEYFTYIYWGELDEDIWILVPSK
jgi:hypothetical protein